MDVYLNKTKEELIGELKEDPPTYLFLRTKKIHSLCSSSRASMDVYLNKTKEELIGELKEAERRYQSLLECLRLPVISFDRDLSIQWANEAFAKTTQYSLSEIVGQHFISRFLPPTERKRSELLYCLCFAGLWEPLSYFENELLTKSGEVLPMAWNLSVLRSVEGPIRAITLVGEELGPPKPAPLPLPPQQPLLIGNYQLGEPLGKNSKVRFAVHKNTKAQVAIKVLVKEKMEEGELLQARREIEIMSKLTGTGNVHITKLIEAIETPSHFYIIMEYINGGEMLGYILKNKGLSEQQSHYYFRQILSALNTCHQNQIIHRDLKHQNILLDSSNNVVKVIDFGLSNFYQFGTPRKTFAGTPAYASPEILLGLEYEGPEVDIWSLGVVLYSMLAAEFPYRTVPDVLIGKFQEISWASPELNDLLKGMMKVDRKMRLTLDQIQYHPWVVTPPPTPSVDNMLISSPIKRRKVFGPCD